MRQHEKDSICNPCLHSRFTRFNPNQNNQIFQPLKKMKMLLHLTIATMSLTLIALMGALTILYFIAYVIAHIFKPTKKAGITIKYNDMIDKPTLVINVHGDLVDKEMDEAYNSVKAIISHSQFKEELLYCSSYINDFMAKFSQTPGYRELMEDLKIEYSALMCKVFPI